MPATLPSSVNRWRTDSELTSLMHAACPIRNWRASAVLLELQIKAAMRGGDAMTIELKPEGVAQERKIILNPQALPFVVLTYGD